MKKQEEKNEIRQWKNPQNFIDWKSMNNNHAMRSHFWENQWCNNVTAPCNIVTIEIICCPAYAPIQKLSKINSFADCFSMFHFLTSSHYKYLSIIRFQTSQCVETVQSISKMEILNDVTLLHRCYIGGKLFYVWNCR